MNENLNQASSVEPLSSLQESKVNLCKNNFRGNSYSNAWIPPVCVNFFVSKSNSDDYSDVVGVTYCGCRRYGDQIFNSSALVEMGLLYEDGSASLFYITTGSEASTSIYDKNGHSHVIQPQTSVSLAKLQIGNLRNTWVNNVDKIIVQAWGSCDLVLSIL